MCRSQVKNLTSWPKSLLCKFGKFLRSKTHSYVIHSFPFKFRYKKSFFHLSLSPSILASIYLSIVQIHNFFSKCYDRLCNQVGVILSQNSPKKDFFVFIWSHWWWMVQHGVIVKFNFIFLYNFYLKWLVKFKNMN